MPYDELGSLFFSELLDPTNIIVLGNEQQIHHILDEAFDLLGKDIMLAHTTKSLDDSFGLPEMAS